MEPTEEVEPLDGDDAGERTPTFYQAVEQFRRKLLIEALTTHCGNRTAAARALGIRRSYLQRLIRRHRVEAPRECASSTSAKCSATV
jgi:DNA-binding NtrC family response regulator